MRARSLKPSFFKNELLAVADPLHSLIFAGLWCLADREGRLEDRPARIHFDINPGRAFETTTVALEWLTKNGFITRYQHGADNYIQVDKFGKHQNPHVKEPESKIPKPGASPVQEPVFGSIYKSETPVLTPCEPGSSLVPARLTPDSGLRTPDSLNLEPRVSKTTTRKSPKTEIPEDFRLTPERQAYAEKHLPQVDSSALLESFRSTSKAKGWQYVDWDAHWQTLVRNWAPNSGHWSSGQYPRQINGKEAPRW